MVPPPSHYFARRAKAKMRAMVRAKGDDIRRNSQDGLLADVHGGDALVPALDDLAHADLDLEGAAAGVEGAVESISKLGFGFRMGNRIGSNRIGNVHF